MKKLLFWGSISVVVLFALCVMPVSAANITIGNDASLRLNIDTYSNFVIVDTNHPANADGVINSIDYYAANANPVRFLLVDSSKKVKWISDEITPNASTVNTLSITETVNVSMGDNIGMYFKNTGTIPFSYTEKSGNVYWQGNGTGLPEIGDTLNTENIPSQQHREYSFIAHGKTPLPISKDECKKGGWELFGVFKNQGDCVSFATQGRNKQGTHEKATGQIVALAGSASLNLIFDAHNTDPLKGNVAYTNSAGKYFNGSVDVCYIQKDNKATFAGHITDSNYGLAYFIVDVIDIGEGDNAEGQDAVRVRVQNTEPNCTIGSSFPGSVIEGNIQVH